MLAANLDDLAGFTARLGQPSVGRHNALGSGILDRRRPTWDRCWADRQPGMPALGIPKARRFSTGMPGLCSLWLLLAQ